MILVVNNNKENPINYITNDIFFGLEKLGMDIMMVTGVCRDYNKDNIIEINNTLSKNIFDKYRYNDRYYQYVYKVLDLIKKNKFDYIYFGDSKLFEIVKKYSDFNTDLMSVTVHLPYSDHWVLSEGSDYISLSKNHMASSYGYSDKFIYNGIDVGYEKEDDTDEYFLYSGRLCREKGFHFVMDLLDMYDINLKIMGFHNEADEIFYNRDLDKYTSRDNIEYMGYVEDNDIYMSVMGKAKGLIMPTNWNEPFGLTTLESLLVGTPIITSDRGTPKEIMGDYGIIQDISVFEDPRKFMGELKKLPNINMGGSNKYIKENFSKENMVKKYYDHITDKLDRG